jgi:iron complex transport system substrate-binding protein
MVGGAALLAACGSDDNGDESDGSESSTSTGAGSGASATRTFVDVTGTEIEVPDRAQRIVAIHDINAGVQLLSLGAPVVGIATRDDGARPDVTRYFDVADIAEVGVVYEPNLEAIASLEPDLIVGEGFDGAGMDQFMEGDIQASLEQIAPVVYIDTFRPVEDVMADFAELVGGAATEDVTDQQAEFESVMADLETILGAEWSEVDAANVRSGEPPSVGGPTAEVWADIITRLGVRWVPIVEEAGNDENAGFLELSEERLTELESDLLVVGIEFDQSILDSPIYQSLDVVAADQVLLIEEPSAGTHWRNYVQVARDLQEGLATRTIQTDLV